MFAYPYCDICWVESADTFNNYAPIHLETVVCDNLTVTNNSAPNPPYLELTRFSAIAAYLSVNSMYLLKHDLNLDGTPPPEIAGRSDLAICDELAEPIHQLIPGGVLLNISISYTQQGISSMYSGHRRSAIL